MIKNRGRWLLLGFLLFAIGITAIILQLVGIQYAFLAFLEHVGGMFAFVVKALMTMAGAIIFVLASTDWDRERRQSS